MTRHKDAGLTDFLRDLAVGSLEVRERVNARLRGDKPYDLPQHPETAPHATTAPARPIKEPTP